jgi:hypothetical protein
VRVPPAVSLLRIVASAGMIGVLLYLLDVGVSLFGVPAFAVGGRQPVTTPA